MVYFEVFCGIKKGPFCILTFHVVAEHIIIMNRYAIASVIQLFLHFGIYIFKLLL